MSFGIVMFLLFIGLVVFILYKDRKNIKVEGIFLMRKTSKGIKLIENIYSSCKKFWNLYSNLSFLISPFAIAFGSYLIIKNAYKILIGVTKIGAGIILPSATSQPVIGSGYIFLPLWLWIVGILSIVIPHEISHGIVSLNEKIKIRNVGYAFLLFIPAAFVEPDEKMLKKASSKKKIKIFGAGSLANFILAFSCILINFLLFNTMFTGYGVSYSGLVNNSPAFNASLNGTIVYLNGVRVKSINDFSNIMKNVTPGEFVNVTTEINNSQKKYTIKTFEEDGRSLIGIYGVTNYYKIKEFFVPVKKAVLFVLYLLSWIGALNLGVGIVNMLPIKPLDGGLIMQEYLKWKFNNYVKIANIISIIFAIILLFNIIGPKIITLVV